MHILTKDYAVALTDWVEPIPSVVMFRDDHIHRPHETRLRPTHPLFENVLAAHRAAIAQGLPTYRDPYSGLAVFTAQLLANRGYCCESGCRHCPYVGVD